VLSGVGDRRKWASEECWDGDRRGNRTLTGIRKASNKESEESRKREREIYAKKQKEPD
jgi:hypothetical protein